MEIKNIVWTLEAEDDIYIISIYISAIIYYKGKKTVTIQMIPPKNLFRSIMHYLNDNN